MELFLHLRWTWPLFTSLLGCYVDSKVLALKHSQQEPYGHNSSTYYVALREVTRHGAWLYEVHRTLLTTDRFYIALFSAVEQTHCARM